MLICEAATASSIARFNSTYMNKKLKIIIQFKKLHQNIQRNQDETPGKKKNNLDRFWTALYISYKFLSDLQCALKLLFKDCIKQQEMSLQQISQIVTHVSELFCDALQTNYECYSYNIQQFSCFGARQKFMLILLYLVQSKYTKNSKIRNSLHRP